MKLQDTQITNYLTFCKTQKCLDEKTIRAYKIDLTQFSSSMSAETSLYDITSRQLEAYIAHLHSIYKPKTSKRKIASLKAFFHYCEFYEFIEKNPFDKIQIRFREPIILPKTIAKINNCSSLLVFSTVKHFSINTAIAIKFTAISPL